MLCRLPTKRAETGDPPKFPLHQFDAVQEADQALARPLVIQRVIQIIDRREEIFSENLVPTACATREFDMALPYRT